MTTHASHDDLSPNLGARERAYVFAVAMKYVKNEVDAEDVTQDALLLAHRHRDSFRGDARYGTWLYRVAATTALMFLRSRKRRSIEILAAPPRGEADDSLLERRDPASSAEHRVAAREALADIAARVDDMGDKYPEVFWLRFAEGYTEPQIARRLDLPLSTVKTRSFRARRVAVGELVAA